MDKNDIYEDYESFKHENYELISTLVKHDSKIISRFSPVLMVVDYLSLEYKKRKLSEDEKIFFSTGFDYIYDNFSLINSLFEFTFKKDMKEMEKCAKTINLLLYVNEFIDEAHNTIEITESDIKPLLEFKGKLIETIEKHKNIEDEYFVYVNELVDNLFASKNVELHTIDEIYYEIAQEYGIYQEDDLTIYNDILNAQIAKTRK
ncbi:MAG: hypothetical protein IKP77_02010 [Acholeplasmatales bacterium]|nr:hypothetical protein [Acholeplasmatales bacterium]